MNAEDKIRIVHDQLIGRGNLDVIGEVFSTDYVAHAGDELYSGHGFLKRFAGQIRSAIPDIQVLKVKFLAQTGNIITFQRTLCGTHRADLMGIPPSGKKVTWTEMVVARFEVEKIAEEWIVSELAGELLSKLPASQ